MWRALCTIYDLGANSVRHSLPYDYQKKDLGTTDARVLTFASLHISVVLLEAVASAFALTRQTGQMQDPSSRAGFQRLSVGILERTGDHFDLRIRLDPLVRRTWPDLVGKFPALLMVRGGKVDLSDYSLALGELRMQGQSADLFENLMEFNGFEFSAFFIECWRLSARIGPASPYTIVFKQVLWGTLNRIEKRIGAFVGARDQRGLKRELSNAPTDVLASCMVLKGVYDPRNKRHTAAQLCRYIEATNMAMAPAQFLSFAGPDASKIGTDFCCSVGAIANQTSGKTAVLCPQDL